MFTSAGLIDGGVIPLSTAFFNDAKGYIDALSSYRYDGEERAPSLSEYVDRFLTYVESATAAAEHFADAATGLHARWRAAVIGVRTDAALHRAVDVVIENPVASAKFLAEHLEVSLRRAEKLVKHCRRSASSPRRPASTASRRCTRPTTSSPCSRSALRRGLAPWRRRV